MNENKETYTNSEIYEIIKKEIVSLNLKPGQYIGEVDFAKRFNVSRTPIREVFKHLEYDNLLKVIRNKGTVVTPIDFSAIIRFMYMREKVELGLLSDIIGTLSPQDIASLNLLLLKQKKELNENVDFLTKSYAFYELDNEFHKSIFNIANKADIWESISNLMPDYKRFRVVSAEFGNEENLISLYEQHCKILEYLQNEDLENLKLIYKSHIYKGVESFNLYLKDLENYFVI